MSRHFDHLWNDMPKEERFRLMPHAVETQKLHIEQCKNIAIRNHKRHMAELNAWMRNLDEDLEKFKKAEEAKIEEVAK